jgi:hypothetical protein
MFRILLLLLSQMHLRFITVSRSTSTSTKSTTATNALPAKSWGWCDMREAELLTTLVEKARKKSGLKGQNVGKGQKFLPILVTFE